MHAALIECLASAGSDEESAHMWTGDDAPTATFAVPACMPEPGVSDEAQLWGELVISPPWLVFQAATPKEQQEPVSMEVCGAAGEITPIQWSLE